MTRFDDRRREAEHRGRLRGIGIACFVESSGVAPSRFAGMLGARAGFFESASVTMEPDGSVYARLGTHSHGQGHETSMAQILSARLGVPMEKIAIIEGDTDLVPYGTGTFGSRSISVGGSALTLAAGKVIRKGQLIAAHLLEADEADVIFEHGRYSVNGTNHSVSINEVAHAAYVPHNYPLETLEPGLQDIAVYDPKAFAFSNGVHVCEIEIDPETGKTWLARYAAVDDIGTVINPMIATGQVHGGVAQGFGQAILEHVAYDAESGAGADRFVHGLCHSPRQRPADVRVRIRSKSAVHPQSARCQGLRRSRDHRCSRSDHRCRSRCAAFAWCRFDRYADHAISHLAGDTIRLTNAARRMTVRAPRRKSVRQGLQGWC